MQFNCPICKEVVHLSEWHEVVETPQGQLWFHPKCSQNKVVGDGASRASVTTQTNSIGHN